MSDYIKIMSDHMRELGCSEDHITQTVNACSGTYGAMFAPHSEEDAIEYARRHHEIAAEAEAVGLTVAEYVVVKSRFIPDEDYDPAFLGFLCDCVDCLRDRNPEFDNT